MHTLIDIGQTSLLKYQESRPMLFRIGGNPNMDHWIEKKKKETKTRAEFLTHGVITA